MAPPLHAWRRIPSNRHFQPSSAAVGRVNRGFTPRPMKNASSSSLPRTMKKPPSSTPHKVGYKVGRAYGKVKNKLGTKGLLATAMLPGLAGLGAILGTVLKPKKGKKNQEGGGADSSWRVTAHQPFLLRLVSGKGNRWRLEIHRASNEELRALTDVIRNLYDNVVPLPMSVKRPLKKHIREIRRLSALTTPLYERRALLLALGVRLLPFVRAGLRALQV